MSYSADDSLSNLFSKSICISFKYFGFVLNLIKKCYFLKISLEWLIAFTLLFFPLTKKLITHNYSVCWILMAITNQLKILTNKLQRHANYTPPQPHNSKDLGAVVSSLKFKWKSSHFELSAKWTLSGLSWQDFHKWVTS